MNDLTAALALVQLEKLPKYLEKRRYIQKRYNEELVNYLDIPPWSETVQYYCAKIKESKNDKTESVRNNLIEYLSEKDTYKCSF